jgi:DNA-binding MarR family transcriptional regulator
MLKPSILFLRNGVPEKIVIFMFTHHDDETNYSKIARSIGSTYTATYKNLKMLEEMGIVNVIDLNKRNKQLKLTLKGERIVKCIRDFNNL